MKKRNSHGHTPAGWYGALVIFIGFLVAGFGVGAASVWISVVGGAVIVLGMVVALLLQRAGLGQYPPERGHSVASAQAYLGEKRQ